MSFRVTAILLGASLGLASCGPSGSVNVTPAAPVNISGDYAGTVQDSANGSSAATVLLAQHGSSAGGSMTTTVAGAPHVAAISLAVASGNGVSGTIVQDLPSDVTCTFATTGNYAPATGVMTGTYAAIAGCAGEHGTYALTQQCTDAVTNADRRPAFGVPSC